MNENMIGSISHGTLRSEDLIPVFLDTLKELDEQEYHDVMRDHGDLISAVYDLNANEIERDDPCIQEIEAIYNDSFENQMSWLVNDCLFDKLDFAAPEGTYFGAHEGDGADFGFWPLDPDE